MTAERFIANFESAPADSIHTYKGMYRTSLYSEKKGSFYTTIRRTSIELYFQSLSLRLNLRLSLLLRKCLKSLPLVPRSNLATIIACLWSENIKKVPLYLSNLSWFWCGMLVKKYRFPLKRKINFSSTFRPACKIFAYLLVKRLIKYLLFYINWRRMQRYEIDCLHGNYA